MVKGIDYIQKVIVIKDNLRTTSITDGEYILSEEVVKNMLVCDKTAKCTAQGYTFLILNRQNISLALIEMMSNMDEGCITLLIVEVVNYSYERMVR